MSVINSIDTSHEDMIVSNIPKFGEWITIEAWWMSKTNLLATQVKVQSTLHCKKSWHELFPFAVLTQRSKGENRFPFFLQLDICASFDEIILKLIYSFNVWVVSSLGNQITQQKNGYNFEIFITLMFKLFIFKKQVEHMYFIILSLLIYVKCTAYELLVHIGCIHQLKKYYAAKFHRCCNIGYPFTNEKYFYCYLLMVLAWCSVGLLWNKASNLLIRQIDQDLWCQRGTTDPCYWT